MQTVPAQLVITDQYDTVVIRPAMATAADPVMCKEWDLGSPEIRVTSTPRNGTDGTYDGAGFTGARTVTFDLAILGDDVDSAYALAERLAAFAHPSRRPTLQISRATVDTGGDVWEMGLRGTPLSIAYGRRAAALLEMQLTFNAPLGYLISPLRNYESIAAGVITVGGFTLPVTLPFSFAAGSGTNPTVDLFISTSAPVSPVIAVYGPVSDPEIATGSGERFRFDGLSLGPGEFVVIDMDAGTVLRADASVYNLVDFTVSTFWRWMPGPKTVTYLASSGRMQIQFRERRITI